MTRASRAARAALALLLLLTPARLRAQACGQGEPPRPALGRGADANDWEAYYDWGVKRLGGRQATVAAAAFYWASRLDPRRAEPLYARWVAFHMCDVDRFQRYLQGDEQVRGDSLVRAHDALRGLATLRNPFVHRGLEMAAYDQLPGRWRDDAATRGMIAYANVELARAATLFGVAIRQQPERHRWLRATRAQVFVGLQQYDSAAAELAALRDELVLSEQTARRPSLYESKEWPEYALGVLQAATGRPRQARDSFGRALAEHLGFYPARVALAELALTAGRADEAVEEYERALEIADGDPVVRYELGRALLRAGRAADALAALEPLARAEPHFAAALAPLGQALEATGDRARAAEAYEAYVKRAPKAQATVVEAVRARLAALGAAGSGG